MDRKNDYQRFVVLMNTIGEATPQGKPSPEKTEIYFRCLEDMTYVEVEQSMMNHLKREKFFPTIAEIRGESDKELELKAQEDYAIICELVDNFVFPDFPQSGFNVIEMKLKEMNREDLLPLANQWGFELVYSTNPTATRAQFLKAHKAQMEISMKRLGSDENKQIQEHQKFIKELVDNNEEIKQWVEKTESRG